MIPFQNLTDYEFRLIHTLHALAGSEQVVEARCEELGLWTGNKSRSTVLRALRGLESHGLIQVLHTRLAGGYQGPSKYVLQGVTGATLVESQSVMGDTATGDYVATVTNSHDYSHKTKLVRNSNTTYYYRGLRPRSGDKQEVGKSMAVKYDDGDDIGGFGLLEPKEDSKPAPRKSDPKTRWRRPKEEWLPADVAAEFAFEVGKKIPWAPGIVNQRNLALALAKQRKQFGITPMVELEILYAFLADEDSFRDVGDKVPHLYKKYLGMFRTHLNYAHEKLGLHKAGVTVTVPSEVQAVMLTASDGTEFDNTIAGRAFLKKHEEQLTKGQ